MNSKSLKLFICSVALCLGAALASAQVKEISHDFSSFDTIDADYYFHVNVVKVRKGYSVTMTVDDILLDFVQTYVRNHTLYLTLDKKSLPSDIKKLYKGRNTADPLLNATVYVPEDLVAIKLAGNATLSVEDEMECKDFDINISDNAQIKRLELDGATVTVTSSNKSFADLRLYADKIIVKAEGNSTLDIEQDSEAIEVTASANSEVEIDGETLDAVVSSSGSSKVTLKGKTGTLDLTGAGVSSIDAINLQTAECSVKLSGNSKAYETASEKLKIELQGGSTLVYDLEPAIEIVNVKSSTIQKYANTKK